MADLIIVLDGARVVEAGSHEELIAKGGTYSELYLIQAAAYENQSGRSSSSHGLASEQPVTCEGAG
jgi:hypothetical protein